MSDNVQTVREDERATVEGVALKLATLESENADLRRRMAEAEEKSTNLARAYVAERDKLLEAERWASAAKRLGESLCSVGPESYYSFIPEQWLSWALGAVAEAERAGMERAAKALNSMRFGHDTAHAKSYDEAIDQGIDAIRALMKEADREQNYLMGGCTKAECLLCHTPKYARKPGMHHAGISVWQEADRG